MKNKTFANSPKHLALCGILCGISLIIFIIEAQIPIPVPIPGVKLGLANIVTLFSLIYLPKKEVLSILIARIILGSVFSSAPIMIIYSLSGGLLCLLGEIILLKLFSKKFLPEISICGAMLHNIGQICCAALIVKTTAVFAYLPYLLIFGSISGLFCGFCTHYVDKLLGQKICKLLD